MQSTVSLYNEDCLTTMKKMNDSSIDLILTDPPYNLGKFMQDRQTNLGKMRENFFGDAGWDDSNTDDWLLNMDVFLEDSARILKSKGTLIMFSSILKIESLVKLAEKHGFYYKTTGIWHKKNPMPRNMNLHFINSTEAWIYFINDGRTGTYENNGKAIHDFIETSLTPQLERKHGKHPTQKPEELFNHFIEILSHENDTVFDPFMGSGTSAVVAQKLNREFIGCEIDKSYFEIAQSRVNDSIQLEGNLEIEST